MIVYVSVPLSLSFSLSVCVCVRPYIINISYVCNDFLGLALAVPRLVAAYYIKSKAEAADDDELSSSSCTYSRLSSPSLSSLCFWPFLARLASLRCLFVIAWPNALPSTAAFHFHLPSATCHSCHSCHLPLATRLLCAVLAHVYSILSLPVPLDLRGMLTAICMESSSCLAWLDASTPLLPSSAQLSLALLGRRPNVTLVYLPL